MDRITKSLLEEFVKRNDIKNLSEDKAFEHFASFLVTSIHYSDSFATDDIIVGEGNDCGIDSITIIANGSFISEEEEISDLVELNDYLDVNFIFMQSEKSSSFESSKIGQFGFGVEDFISEQPTLPQNSRIQNKHKILNKIFSYSSKFKKGNPQCYLYYVTTGKWTEDVNLISRINSVIHDLESANIFSKIIFQCVDAASIQKLDRNSKNIISREIIFTTKTVYPDIKGVEQAYLGLLPTSEFLKLIENSDGEIIGSLFYDNVRHWQEWNPVNSEMRTTLETATTQLYFPLLNNGVTIIAKNIIPTGNRFVIEDYQVVNGCQTSYVLHSSKERFQDDIFIPVRLIATQDPEIKNLIIKATNRQTEIPEEQLFAMTDFSKKLEQYFPTFDGNKKLYYERRSGQYNSEESIEKVRIISMNTLIKAFSSMFLELPHRTSRNYKAILQNIGKDVLNKDHCLEMYYTSAYAHYRLEYLFRSQFLPSEYKTARYHILMAYRILTNRELLPRFNSHDMIKYCNVIMESLWDDTNYRLIFKNAVSIVDLVASGNMDADNIRTEPFTEKIKTVSKEWEIYN